MKYKKTFLSMGALTLISSSAMALISCGSSGGGISVRPQKDINYLMKNGGLAGEKAKKDNYLFIKDFVFWLGRVKKSDFFKLLEPYLSGLSKEDHTNIKQKIEDFWTRFSQPMIKRQPEDFVKLLILLNFKGVGGYVTKDTLPSDIKLSDIKSLQLLFEIFVNPKIKSYIKLFLSIISFGNIKKFINDPDHLLDLIRRYSLPDFPSFLKEFLRIFLNGNEIKTTNYYEHLISLVKKSIKTLLNNNDEIEKVVGLEKNVHLKNRENLFSVLIDNILDLSKFPSVWTKWKKYLNKKDVDTSKLVKESFELFDTGRSGKKIILKINNNELPKQVEVKYYKGTKSKPKDDDHNHSPEVKNGDIVKIKFFIKPTNSATHKFPESFIDTITVKINTGTNNFEIINPSRSLPQFQKKDIENVIKSIKKFEGKYNNQFSNVPFFDGYGIFKSDKNQLEYNISFLQFLLQKFLLYFSYYVINPESKDSANFMKVINNIKERLKQAKNSESDDTKKSEIDDFLVSMDTLSNKLKAMIFNPILWKLAVVDWKEYASTIHKFINQEINSKNFKLSDIKKLFTLISDIDKSWLKISNFINESSEEEMKVLIDMILGGFNKGSSADKVKSTRSIIGKILKLINPKFFGSNAPNLGTLIKNLLFGSK